MAIDSLFRAKGRVKASLRTEIRVCQFCGRSYKPARERQKYCSRKCAHQGWSKLNKEHLMLYHQVYNKEYYLKNGYKRQHAYNRRHREEFKNRQKEVKAEILLYYSQNGQPQCAYCGISDIDVLNIDHISGGGTKHRRQIGFGTNFYRWLKKNNFPEGYQVLCANCNLKKRITKGE